jgi:hypothetical protein
LLAIPFLIIKFLANLSSSFVNSLIKFGVFNTVVKISFFLYALIDGLFNAFLQCCGFFSDDEFVGKLNSKFSVKNYISIMGIFAI